MTSDSENAGPWLTSAGFGTAIIGGPIPTVEQKQLTTSSLKVIFLDGRGPRQSLASYGSSTGVGDLPDKWRPEDYLRGTRTYQIGAVKADQVDILADDNDTYLVEIFADNGSKTDLIVPTASGGGLRWRAMDLPPSMAGHAIERIEIRPGQGDGVFAVRAVVLGG